MNMTHYVVIGISHQQSAVVHREKLSIPSDEIPRWLPAIIGNELILECVVLSTCNRMEFYLVTENPETALSHLSRCLHEMKGEAAMWLFDHGYRKRDGDCAQHLLRVAAGLESQVVGEPQILNQVKSAHHVAREAGATGIFLNRLFDVALHAGKRVRHETAIGTGAVSIASAAVELLRRNLIANNDASVLLLGAGEMAEGAAMHLMAKKPCPLRLRIASRSRHRAEVLAQRVGGESVAWEQVAECLAEATAIITAVASPQAVLRAEDFSGGERPRLCIDIGLPRNIDPQVAKLPGLRLFDLDDLNGVIDKNLQVRLAELPKAEKIINELSAEFDGWYHALKVVPIIKDLFRYGDEIRQREVERSRKKFRPEEWDQLNALAASLVNRLLHLPVLRLKAWANDPQVQDHRLAAVCDFLTMKEDLASQNPENRHAAE